MHIPKTGGASIVRVLKQYHVRIIGHNRRGPKYRSLADYKGEHPDCFAFAFVRNPWDRVVSAYFFLRQGGLNKLDRADSERYLRGRDFTTFVREAFRDREIFRQVHFRPQYLWISNKNGLVVDSLEHFEDLEAGFKRYMRRFGLPAVTLPHRNRGTHRDFRTYYDESTWKIVARAYATDIRLFKYQSDFVAPAAGP